MFTHPERSRCSVPDEVTEICCGETLFSSTAFSSQSSSSSYSSSSSSSHPLASPQRICDWTSTRKRSRPTLVTTGTGNRLPCSGVRTRPPPCLGLLPSVAPRRTHRTRNTTPIAQGRSCCMEPGWYAKRRVQRKTGRGGTLQKTVPCPVVTITPVPSPTAVNSVRDGSQTGCPSEGRGLLAPPSSCLLDFRSRRKRFARVSGDAPPPGSPTDFSVSTTTATAGPPTSGSAILSTRVLPDFRSSTSTMGQT